MARHEQLSVGTLDADVMTGGGSVPLTQGTKYYVDPTGGSDGNDGLSPTHAKATVSAAYTAATANQNDTIFYMAGSSSITLTATMTWAKNYTHLIGVVAPTNVAQRARFFVGTNVFTPMVNITATGCRFENLYFFHGVADATALICGQVTGGRNYFRKVHFAGIGTTTQDAAGAASLSLSGAEECLFDECTIGIDTIGRGSAANSELLITSGALRCTFRTCDFLTFADAATHQFVIKDGSGIDRWIKFENCNFINPIQSTATTMTEAFDVTASGSPNGLMLLKNCTLVGATDWEANVESGELYIDGAAPTNNTSGLAVNVEAT